jgi:hypothetical protein
MKNKKKNFSRKSKNRSGIDSILRFLKWSFIGIGAVALMPYLYEQLDNWLLALVISVMTPICVLVSFFPSSKQMQQFEVDERQSQKDFSDYSGRKWLEQWDRID